LRHYSSLIAPLLLPHCAITPPSLRHYSSLIAPLLLPHCAITPPSLRHYRLNASFAHCAIIASMRHLLIAPLFPPHYAISIASMRHYLWHLVPQSVTFSSNLAPQCVIIPSMRHLLNNPFLLPIHFPHRFTSHTGPPPSKCSLIHLATSSEKKEFDEKPFEELVGESRTNRETAQIMRVSLGTVGRKRAALYPGPVQKEEANHQQEKGANGGEPPPQTQSR